MEAAALAQRVDCLVFGASAGGVEALSQLLPALPAGLRAAVAVVLHLPRERPSRLVEIFRPKCAMRVEEAEDKLPIAPGTIYFAPPDYHLLVEQAVAGRGPRFALSADAPVNFSRPSIDVLFESAADAYGDRLLGVILTGANDDGAAGLEAVGRAGGLTLVQASETAYAPYMVDAARQRWAAASVLSLSEMADLFRTLDRGAAGARDIQQGE